MKYFFVMSCLLAGFLVSSQALAQNKVVVVPLSSGKRVAGDNMQLQYNDNGTQAGANVYYDKNTGNVGIKTNIADDDLTIVDLNGDGGIYVGSATQSYVTMESLGGNIIRMLSANNNATTQYPMMIGAKSRGTYNAFEPVLSGDRLLGIFAKGQRTTGIATDFDNALESSAGILFIASEDWTNAPVDTQGGTRITFFTTENATGLKDARMRIEHNGNVGIGTANPLSKLAVSGLPTAPPDGSGNAGVICVTVDGNFWLDADGTADCL